MPNEPQTTAPTSTPAAKRETDSGAQVRGSVWQEIFRSKLLLQRTQQLSDRLKALYIEESR
jgi:hypothetical protein